MHFPVEKGQKGEQGNPGVGLRGAPGPPGLDGMKGIWPGTQHLCNGQAYLLKLLTLVQYSINVPTAYASTTPGDKGDISYPTSEPVEGPMGEKGRKGDDGDVGPVGNTGQPGPRGTPGPIGELNCLGM